MSNKKSRKVGQIGTPKSDAPRQTKHKKPKKHTGKPAGSRHSQAQTNNDKPSKQPIDSRLGSKKPVILVKQQEQTPKRSERFFSPQQELKSLEQDTRLNRLLDKLEQNQTLGQEEHVYVESKMARHHTLCQLLGITATTDQEINDKATTSSEDELWDKWDAIESHKLGDN